MPLTPIALASSGNKGRTGFESAEQIINGFIEANGEGAKHPFSVYANSGFSLFSTLTGGGKSRASIEVNGKLYEVNDRQVFVTDQSGAATNIGGLPTDDPVYMASNRRQPAPQIGLVSAGLYYVIDTNTDTMTLNTDPDLPPPASITHLDGYFIFPTGRRFFWSGVDDATNINGLDFAAAESDPDDTIMAATLDREVVLFGTDSVEWWRNVGGDTPFTRTSAMEIGCRAAGSVKNLDRTIIWVANDGTVRLMEGYGGRIISTPEIHKLIADDPNPQDITASAWTERGKFFYVLTATNWSRQYELISKKWTSRKSKGLDFWRISNVTKFGNKLIAGDYTSGKLYEMSAGTYDENGDELILTVDTPPVHAWPNGLIIDDLYVDIEPGVGLNTTAPENLDPKMMISLSVDAGKSWRINREKPLGRLGQTQTRIKTSALGSIRRNAGTFRFSVSADVAKSIHGAAINAQVIPQ